MLWSTNSPRLDKIIATFSDYLLHYFRSQIVYAIQYILLYFPSIVFILLRFLHLVFLFFQNTWCRILFILFTSFVLFVSFVLMIFLSLPFEVLSKRFRVIDAAKNDLKTKIFDQLEFWQNLHLNPMRSSLFRSFHFCDMFSWTFGLHDTWVLLSRISCLLNGGISLTNPQEPVDTHRKSIQILRFAEERVWECKDWFIHFQVHFQLNFQVIARKKNLDTAMKLLATFSRSFLQNQRCMPR